jgi:hypothetical protein
MRTQTLDDRTQASDPGGIRLDHEKMRRFHPELYTPSGLFKLIGKLSPNQLFWRKRNEEHLQHGDSRAAVVMSVDPLLVAAYTDEMDCVALLSFPPELVAEYGLQVGTRLLTVNLYGRGGPLMRDLQNGPASYRRYSNFRPYIAEFLSSDYDRIEARKAGIEESEWVRAEAMGREYLAKNGPRARDGRPMRCARPA